MVRALRFHGLAAGSVGVNPVRRETRAGSAAVNAEVSSLARAAWSALGCARVSAIRTSARMQAATS
jgi:hypothetical protein